MMTSRQWQDEGTHGMAWRGDMTTPDTLLTIQLSLARNSAFIAWGGLGPGIMIRIRAPISWIRARHNDQD